MGCSKEAPLHWSEFIPDNIPYVIIPEQGATIHDMLSEPYIPLFDDMSPSAIQLISTLEENSSSIEVEAMLLYADTANDWQPVWITKSVSGLQNELAEAYRKPFEQNNYLFNGRKIDKLFISDRVFFVTEISGWMIFSESSLGVENLLRSFYQQEEVMTLGDDQIQPGSVIVNSGGLDQWIHQIIQVTYRPELTGTFEGAGPVSFRINDQPGENQAWQMQGEMELTGDPSPFVRSISSEPADFILDRYIPVNTAAFSIQRLEPRAVPPDDFEPENDTDSYIDQNLSVWRTIASHLDDEFAFAAFAESGAASTSEFLFLRKLSNSSEIRSALNELVNEQLAIRDGNTYTIQSNWLGKLFGSELNPMNDFYLTVYNEVAALANRKGLAESVGSEASRRRVMFYDDDYMDIRDELTGPLSSILYLNSARFGQYIQPWLNPQNYFTELLSNLNQFVITTQAQSGGTSIHVNVSSFQLETEDQPYLEQWVFPLNNSDITGKPILVDIGGSSRDEIVFSTENGSVYALATDGTVVLQTSTENDIPVGPPVIYDWYGNNQNVVMQAAGDKIYAWDDSGNPLPNFPVQLDETITTPLIVMDITRNGVSEMIVATADRKMHILNARGQALSGWPQNTNASITSRPLITQLNGQESVFAFAENTLHAWNVNGSRRNGFPVFMNSPMHGTPAKYNNHLLGSGLDGNLYATGTEGFFADTLSSELSSDSLQVSSLSVSNNALNSSPSVHDLLMRDDSGFFRENLILVQSRDGSLFLYNENGELRFTSSLGQPSSSRFLPVITDLDNNGRQNVVALADFGRLYAWDILNQQRLYDLPTTGMSHLVIGDLLGNGSNEIIAQTRDGLRCWTILQTRTGTEQ
ncbi:MAG: hypothetical protein WEA56_07670 [Balneolaceae bacterium]